MNSYSPLRGSDAEIQRSFGGGDWAVNDEGFDGAMRLFSLPTTFGFRADWSEHHHTKGERNDAYLEKVMGAPVPADIRIFNYYSEPNMMGMQLRPDREDAVFTR